MRRRSLIAALGIAVAGCTSNSEPSSEETQNGTPDNTAEKTETPASPIRDDTVAVGESITYNEQVRVTVDEARLANTVLASGDDAPESPGDGSRFLLVHVTSTNVGEEQARLASDSEFALLLGSDQRSGHPMGYGTTEIAEPVSGPLYEGQMSAFGGVSSSGWLVYKVPADTEHAVIAWGRGEQQYWRADLSPESLPGVQLVSVDIPDTPIRYESTQITLTIENTGGSEGTYETTIGQNLYDSPIEVNVTVLAHETVEETVTLPYATDYASDEATITVGGEEYTISYTTPTRQLGESYSVGGRLRVTVNDVEAGTELQTYNQYSEEYENVSLGNGERWVYVNWEVENLSDELIPSFGSNTISLLDNGSQVGQLELPQYPSGQQEFRGTINGETLSNSGLEPGDSASGYAVFRAPSQHEVADLNVGWSASGRVDSRTSANVVWEQ